MTGSLGTKAAAKPAVKPQAVPGEDGDFDDDDAAVTGSIAKPPGKSRIAMPGQDGDPDDE